jgi:hypothetical protein
MQADVTGDSTCRRTPCFRDDTASCPALLPLTTAACRSVLPAVQHEMEMLRPPASSAGAPAAAPLQRHPVAQLSRAQQTGPLRSQPALVGRAARRLQPQHRRRRAMADAAAASGPGAAASRRSRMRTMTWRRRLPSRRCPLQPTLRRSAGEPGRGPAASGPSGASSAASAQTAAATCRRRRSPPTLRGARRLSWRMRCWRRSSSPGRCAGNRR